MSVIHKSCGSGLAREEAGTALTAVRRCATGYRATLRVVMPFWTLRVLFAKQSVATCIPTLERAER
ncbi:hypothetical protein BVY11_27335 [Pseudomonas amygdali pv. morsprunorum]|nr:hypothetical protein BVY11_27335 [Pseudomonas amygdali pv. morsprunorum]PPS27401.1 hypothetical protein BVY12_26460 [Pseudomonas amygdali pv. morsprunorum]